MTENYYHSSQFENISLLLHQFKKAQSVNISKMMKTLFYHTVLESVINSINSFPGRPAFCINEEHYTYLQFGQCISKIRSELTKTDYNNTKVGLVINDDLETYASIFALWLEGYCYVPLHPNWPLERCLDICNQVEIELVLDSSVDTRYKSIHVIKTTNLIYSEDNLNSNQNISDDELAYFIFTSGSTGKPKGVPIMRKNVATFINALFEFVSDIDENDKCLQCFDLSFDNSVLAYLVPLLKGACMYTVPHNVIKYVYVAELLEDHELTFSYMVPSTIEFLRPYFSQMKLPKLRYSLFAGGPLHENVAREWHDCIPNAKLFCCYGPTETTVIMSYYPCIKGRKYKSYNGIVSMGTCMKGTEVIIMDEEGDVLNFGETGEICIAGNQVFGGYWKDPERNKQCFVSKFGKTWYRSGDYGYIDDSGDIMSAGRKDSQVKIQGYRVELGEIEFHAREYLKKNVVCIAFDNEKMFTEIAMFVESEEFNPDEMIAYMRTKMPSYMIPSRLFFIPVFPLNANDKTDKVKLKAMIQ